MNNTDIKIFKEQALTNSILRIPTSFEEFEFIDAKHLEFKNRVFEVSYQALKDLSKVLGMASNSLKNINHKLGKEISIAIFNNMLKANAKKSNSEILFVINRKGEILRILNEKSSVISNEVFFNIADRIIDQNGLGVHDLSVNQEGELVIQTKSRNSEFQINGFKDEVFESGLSISNTHFGINVDPFVHRLVCTNGMVTKMFDESISINSVNQREMGIFFDQLHRLEMNDFKSSGFSKKVTEAITKAIDNAKKNLIKVPIINGTIPHSQFEKFGGARVLLKPASNGTGVIAGGAMRAVLESVGVHDVLAKSQGSSNPHNLVKATINALHNMRSAKEIAKQRGVSLDVVFNG